MGVMWCDKIKYHFELLNIKKQSNLKFMYYNTTGGAVYSPIIGIGEFTDM